MSQRLKKSYLYEFTVTKYIIIIFLSTCSENYWEKLLHNIYTLALQHKYSYIRVFRGGGGYDKC